MRKVCRPFGRLFYLVWCAVLTATSMAGQASPATTTISDTVFAADGSPAQGTLLISWPAFTTSDGIAIAGGAKSVTLGTGGSLSVSLVPNLNATPTNTPYTVVYQLGNFVKTEYWLVPATSPTTLAVVRVPLGTGNNVSQAATQQYVSSALSHKADLVSGFVPPNQLASGSSDGTSRDAYVTARGRRVQCGVFWSDWRIVCGADFIRGMFGRLPDHAQRFTVQYSGVS